MAKKVVTHKRHGDGLEAPRNSLELPVETCRNFCSAEENMPCPNQVANNWSEKRNYSIEAPIKKLISDEISKRPHCTKQSTPSVVARLMGVDMLPSKMKPAVQQVEKKNEMHTTNLTKKTSRNNSIGRRVSPSKYLRHKNFNSFDSTEGSNFDPWSSSITSNNPRPREHPQEAELQKFKKEFEAWQVARMKECSRVVELGSTPSQWLAQEYLNKEKMVIYANSMEMRERVKPIKLEERTMSTSSYDRGCLHNKEIKSDSHQKDAFCSSNTTPIAYSKLSSYEDSGPELDGSSAPEPSKIVILRPGPDSFCNYEESCPSSPGASEERGSMHDFLEEVKERLKCELQGKSCKKNITVRGGGIETPYSEKPSDPKQIAQRIAKQVRESVTRDLGANLFRSESTSSYRSEIQFNGTESPEFISRDTRKFLAERLRNVLKEETRDVPVVPGSTRSILYNNPRIRTEKSRDDSNAKSRLRYWNGIRGESEMQCRSFRRESNENSEIHEESSPRNLIRSLSAPVSGTSFGKLLLEDRHVLTGAHIRRKHEAFEKITVNVKKRKKEKFNLREKVTSLKYSFTLKGRFFGRKIQSLEEKHNNRHDYVRDVLGRPPMTMSFYDRNENPTEVPPSPASVCSSLHEEFCRPGGYYSPTSISDVASLDDSMTSQVFKDISSNLKELRRQLNQLETDVSEDSTVDEQPTIAERVDIEDQAEAYIRDLLIVSGLYDGSCEKSLARWDPLGKPISNQVFEEVEESCRQKLKDIDEASTKDQGEKSNKKILFDLLNEVLPSVLGPPMSMSSFMKKAIGPVIRPPCGRKLLDQLWQIVHVYVHPPTDRSHYSLDVMVARDLHSSPWSRSIDDDANNALGKDVECQIFGELIDEIVKDLRKCA